MSSYLKLLSLCVVFMEVVILFAHYSLPLKNPQNESGEEIFLEILKCYASGARCSNSIVRE